MGSTTRGESTYLSSAARHSRRRVLGTAVFAALATPALANCSGAASDGPDPLGALARRAHHDAALANAVAREHGALASQAREVAQNRNAHAAVLDREVTRVHPPEQGNPPPPAQGHATPANSPGSAKAQLAEAVRTARQEAEALVPGLPAYRAGMVGSIAASCASMAEVLA